MEARRDGADIRLIKVIRSALPAFSVNVVGIACFELLPCPLSDDETKRLSAMVAVAEESKERDYEPCFETDYCSEMKSDLKVVLYSNYIFSMSLYNIHIQNHPASLLCLSPSSGT